MTSTVIIGIILILTACFKKPDGLGVVASTPVLPVTPIMPTPVKEKLLSKIERESIYFAASLEKEALKLLLKEPSFDGLTLFSVLSYAVEIDSGIKKMAPSLLDCSRFRFERSLNIKSQLNIFKTCEKPEVLVATAALSELAPQMKITFYIKEWAQVLGLSVLTTGDNIICDIEIQNKKLQQLSCENWARSLSNSATAIEELRLKTFRFQRDDAKQFVLIGGRYKDLLERSKINIQVPLQGKITRWEKEIEIVDEFADTLQPPAPMTPTASPPVKRLQINGEKDEAKTESQNQDEAENQNQDESQAADQAKEEKPGSSR